MIKNGVSGQCLTEAVNLQLMSRWDDQEDLAASIANLDLTTGVLGDNSGVGSGAVRNKLYCTGFHNFGTVDCSLVYQVLGAPGKNFTLYIFGGDWTRVLIPISKIISVTSGTTLKALYHDRFVYDGDSPNQEEA